MTSTILENQDSLVSALVDMMNAEAEVKTKQWFENYLKGAITYRGLKTPAVAKLLKAWRTDHNLDSYSLAEQLALCEALIAHPFAEDKFAGIIYIQKYLAKKLEWQTLVAFVDRLFQADYFFDWSTTDWLCVRVLDPTILKHGLPAAEAIAQYRTSHILWQRRAAIVPFRHASAEKTYHALIRKIIADLVQESERFIQTGVGWVLADLSKVYPSEAEALFRQYLPLLSREVIDRHSKHLPAHRQLKQLKRSL